MENMKNSQKGFVVPLIAVIVVLLTVGGGFYYTYSEKTDVPEAVNTINVNSQATSVNSSPENDLVNYSLVYKVSKNNETDIISFDLKTREKSLISKYPYNIKVLYDPAVLTINSVSERQSNNLNNGIFFYQLSEYFDERTDDKISFIKSNLSGEKNGGDIGDNQQSFACITVIGSRNSNSQNNNRWQLAIHNFGTKSTKYFGSTLACYGGPYILGLSKDGKRFLYFHKDGLHALDIVSGEDKIISPDMDDSASWSSIVFWNNPRINFEKKIILVEKSDDDIYRNSVEIRQLDNLSFDYLTMTEIEKLPLVQKLDIPDRSIQSMVLTLDGEGIFFQASPINDYVFTGYELGHFDIFSGKITFPINTLNGKDSPNIFAAIDKNNLFYTYVEGNNYLTGTQKIQRTGTLNSKNDLVDSISAKEGLFSLIAVVKK